MNSNRWATARRMAAEELGVSANTLSGSYVGNDEYEITGREKSVRYRLYCAGMWCVWLRDVRTRAEFDLNCPRTRMTVTSFTASNVGVTGCGKRASYIMTNDGSWALNSSVETDSTAPASPVVPGAKKDDPI